MALVPTAGALRGTGYSGVSVWWRCRREGGREGGREGMNVSYFRDQCHNTSNITRIHMYIRTYSTCKSTFVRMYYITVAMHIRICMCTHKVCERRDIVTAHLLIDQFAIAAHNNFPLT